MRPKLSKKLNSVKDVDFVKLNLKAFDKHEPVYNHPIGVEPQRF
jgi:hypothetical protein